jgi:hypothetical protein
VQDRVADTRGAPAGGVILSRLKLTLHPTKTQVVHVGDGRQASDFLGFHCQEESWKYRGERYLQRWPNRRAMQQVRDRIKAITAPRHRLPEPIRADRGRSEPRGAQSAPTFEWATRRANSTTWTTTCPTAWRCCSPRRRGGLGDLDALHLGVLRKTGVHLLVGTVKWYTAMLTTMR